MKITTPTPLYKAALAAMYFSAFWWVVMYVAEGRKDLLGAIEPGIYFGVMYWFGLSLVSTEGQINKLLRKYGLIGHRDE